MPKFERFDGLIGSECMPALDQSLRFLCMYLQKYGLDVCTEAEIGFEHDGGFNMTVSGFANKRGLDEQTA